MPRQANWGLPMNLVQALPRPEKLHAPVRNQSIPNTPTQAQDEACSQRGYAGSPLVGSQSEPRDSSAHSEAALSQRSGTAGRPVLFVICDCSLVRVQQSQLQTRSLIFGPKRFCDFQLFVRLFFFTHARQQQTKLVIGLYRLGVQLHRFLKVALRLTILVSAHQ